jgi:hypothetical protein
MPLSTRFVLDWLKATWTKMKKEQDMSGDLIVCGVSADEVIEDLGKIVPKSVATHISALNANKSKDLWRLLSQSRLIQLNVNPLLRAPSATAPTSVDEGAVVLQAEYNKAVAEVAKLRSDLASARSELVRANEEIARLKGDANHATKLDDILTLLKERPVTQVVMGHMASPQSVLPVDDDVPMYIPSQIKSDVNEESRVAVKEESTSSTTLSDASKALREKRKKQQ